MYLKITKVKNLNNKVVLTTHNEFKIVANKVIIATGYEARKYFNKKTAILTASGSNKLMEAQYNLAGSSGKIRLLNLPRQNFMRFGSMLKERSMILPPELIKRNVL